jgi:hypothetical protein
MLEKHHQVLKAGKTVQICGFGPSRKARCGIDGHHYARLEWFSGNSSVD